MKNTPAPTAAVAAKINSYPEPVSEALFHLRDLIYQVAGEYDEIGIIDETLKWGQPSYVTKNGSTLRIDGNTKAPDRYFMYFHCQTRLIETFHLLYPDQFTFDGKRALVFSLHESLPENELRHCIAMALRYHLIKHLPLLGA
ncbi:MAG: DUF1801 domain-containing protein [Thiolinea sp.]